MPVCPHSTSLFNYPGILHLCDERGLTAQPDLEDACVDCVEEEAPFVSEAEHAELCAVRTAAELESRYGAGIRDVPEYQGLSSWTLHACLGRRQAVCIAAEAWAPCPVRVSRQALETWLAQYAGKKVRRPVRSSTSRPRITALGVREVEAGVGGFCTGS